MAHWKRTRATALVLVAIAGGTARLAVAAPAENGYEIRLLPVPGYAEVRAMSEVSVNGGAPTIVGSYTPPHARNDHAFMVLEGRLTDLHDLLTFEDPRRGSSEAVAVGTGVLGTKRDRRGDFVFWYVNGQMMDGAANPQLRDTRALGLTYQGEPFVGFGSLAHRDARRLFGGAFGDLGWAIGDRWTPLPRLAPNTVVRVKEVLTDVTGNHAVFVGQANDDKGRPHAVRGDAREGTIAVLPPLHGEQYEARAVAVNRRERVAGASVGPSPRHADRRSEYPCVWVGGRARSLTEVPAPVAGNRVMTGFERSPGEARDISVDDVLVGNWADHRVLWALRDAAAWDLATMRTVPLSQVVPVSSEFKIVGEVWKINDAGWIVCSVGKLSADRRQFEYALAFLVPRGTFVRPPAPPTGLTAELVRDGSFAYENVWAGSAREEGPGDRPPDALAGHVRLRWTPPADGVLWYEVDRRLSGGAWEYLSAWPGDATSYIDEEAYMRRRTEATYRLRAASYAGVSGPSNTVSVMGPGTVLDK